MFSHSPCRHEAFIRYVFAYVSEGYRYGKLLLHMLFAKEGSLKDSTKSPGPKIEIRNNLFNRKLAQYFWYFWIFYKNSISISRLEGVEISSKTFLWFISTPIDSIKNWNKPRNIPAFTKPDDFFLLT